MEAKINLKDLHVGSKVFVKVRDKYWDVEYEPDVVVGIEGRFVQLQEHGRKSIDDIRPR